MFDESVRRERKYEGIDLQTPINAPLSALYRRLVLIDIVNMKIKNAINAKLNK